MSLPIHIYFHVLPVNHYQRLIEHIIRLNPRLFGAAARVVFSVNGDGPVDTGGVSNVSVVRNPNTYELPTLERLIDDARTQPPFYLLYLHTKGVTHTAWNDSLQDWLDYMLYFAVERADDCIAALARHDTCGVDLKSAPYPHYSGNFWWARSDWINTLPHPLAVPSAPFGERHKCEFWVASQPGRHLALHDSGISVYERDLHRYPPWHYRHELLPGHLARRAAAHAELFQHLAVPAAPGALLRIGLQRGPSLAQLAQSVQGATALLGCDPHPPQLAQLAAPVAPLALTLLSEPPNAPASFARVLAAASYRLVWDDGSHSAADVLLSFLNYFPLLLPGGCYVVEGLLPQAGRGGGDALIFFGLLARHLAAQGPEPHAELVALLSALFPGQEAAVLARVADVAAVEWRYEMVLVRKTASV